MRPMFEQEDSAAKYTCAAEGYQHTTAYSLYRAYPRGRTDDLDLTIRSVLLEPFGLRTTAATGRFLISL